MREHELDIIAKVEDAMGQAHARAVEAERNSRRQMEREFAKRDRQTHENTRECSNLSQGLRNVAEQTGENTGRIANEERGRKGVTDTLFNGLNEVAHRVTPLEARVEELERENRHLTERLRVVERMLDHMRNAR